MRAFPLWLGTLRFLKYMNSHIITCIGAYDTGKQIKQAGEV